MSLYYKRLYNKVVSVQVQPLQTNGNVDVCLPQARGLPLVSGHEGEEGQWDNEYYTPLEHPHGTEVPDIWWIGQGQRDPCCLELISAEVSLGPFLSHPTKEYLAWGDRAQLLMISIHNTMVLACWVAITYDCKLYYDGIQHWINKVYSQDAVSLKIQCSCYV